MSLLASAQITIQMEKDGGVYKVPCNVNGVKMKFIFDTGASTVSMSQTMAQFLLDGEYLSVSDIKGVGQSVVADGTIVNHAIIILRDIEIGGLHLKNIRATVLESQNAPLLLGQTAISELGRITIDGNKLIIHTGNNNKLTDEQISQLDEHARRYIERSSYAAAIECLEKIDEAVGLSQFGLWELCLCYCENRQFSQCVQACNRWLNEFESTGENRIRYFIYDYLRISFLFGIKDYNKALLWSQKQSNLVSNDEEYYDNLLSQALCYESMSDFYRAIERYKQFIDWKLIQLRGNRSEKVFGDLFHAGKIHDEDFGMVYYSLANCEYAVGNNQSGDYDMIAAAHLGFELAQNYCKAHSFKQLYPGVQFNF